MLDAGTDTSKFVEVQINSLDIQNPQNPQDECIAAYVEFRDYPLGQK